MITYRSLCGRLGENIQKIYGLFYFCIENDIPLENIFINKNRIGYDYYQNMSYPLKENFELFDNIKQYFVEIEHEDYYLHRYRIISWEMCKNLNILNNVISDKNADYILDNYWFAPMNRKLFKTLFKPYKLVERIKDKYNLDFDNICTLHVRLGDCYFIAKDKKSLNYGSLRRKIPPTVDQINYMIERGLQLHSNIKKFICSSDDIEWCKNNLQKHKDKIIFIDGNKAYEDILLISLCKYHITLSSSWVDQVAYLLQDNYDLENDMQMIR